MNRSLSIVIADDEPRMREFFCKTLERLGHQVVAEAASGHDLIVACRENVPDLVITDIQMPDMDGIDAAAALATDQAIPIILVSAFHDAQFIERARQNHILAYLIKPITDTDLQPAIAIAMSRFQEFQTLRRETSDLKQALEDRKLIERAKGILMKQTGLEEPEAFRRLQKISSSKSVKLVEIARTIVTADEAMRNPN